MTGLFVPFRYELSKTYNPGKYKYILLYLYVRLPQETRQGVAGGRGVPAGLEWAEITR